MFNLKEIATTSMVLFAVIDIVGSVPVVIDLRQKAGTIDSGKASVVAMCIMMIFLFVGESLLGLIGIDIQSFAVAGSFVIFFIALEMILGIRLYKDTDSGAASIVPLAFPLIAGAGTLTSLLSMQADYQMPNIIVAITINMILVYFTLQLSGKLERLLGEGGLSVLRKVFGVILLAIAVKLFRTNIGL